jgi:hypothetical protein
MWGVKIDPANAVGIGSLVTENTKVTCNGVEISNSHHVEAADYHFHGSNKVDTNCVQYKLNGTLSFTYNGAAATIDFFDVFTVKP